MTRRARRPGPGLFSIGLGFAGLAGCWRIAGPRIGAPGWVADAIALVSLVTLVGVAVPWGRAALRDPAMVADPAVAVLPITAGLLAIDLRPHAQGLATVLFVVFGVATMVAALGLPAAWIGRGVALESLHPGYLGALAVVVLGSLVLWRLRIGPPLPPPLIPTLALGVAAPALTTNTFLVIAGSFDAAAWALVGATTAMALVQVGLLRRYDRAPFAPPAWSWAFAYATTATMTLRVVDHEGVTGADALRWAILAAITGLLAVLGVRSVRAPGALLG